MTATPASEAPGIVPVADTSLGWAIGVVFRAWQQGVAAALDELPHGPRGHQILVYVSRGDLPTQASVAAHLGIDRTVLTYVLDDLVAAGVIQRQTDSTDRRVRRLAMTSAGVERLVDLDRRVSAAEQAIFAGLSPEEERSLRSALHHAATAIQPDDPERDTCSVVADILGTDDPPHFAAGQLPQST
jgi:MarR family transcriptional regulator for hemolysin